ncbi:MAG: MATE family efflux transporter [Eubacteriales bacterium]|nr:MATE family efflux transporter [Eubacteriales bacterium]
MWLVAITGATLSVLILVFRQNVLSLYSSDAEVIGYATRRMIIILSAYFLCGVMDTFVGSLRGLGYSVMPMIVATIGACGLRIVWIYTIFAWSRSLQTLYLAYPLSWIITTLAHWVCFMAVRKKFPKEDAA